MITDESGLRWFAVLVQRDEAAGGECVTWRCAQHRRVTKLLQRPNRDAEWTTTYAVDGIAAQYYHSADEAVRAMEANPA